MNDPQDHQPAPTAPEQPGEYDCCEGGCAEACVWEKYYLERDQYARALTEWQERQSRAKPE